MRFIPAGQARARGPRAGVGEGASPPPSPRNNIKIARDNFQTRRNSIKGQRNKIQIGLSSAD
jgi:hypothetical protein